MKKSSRFLGLAVTAALLAGASTAAFAQDAQEEVNKQIAKLIGDAISSRVSARALDAAGQGQATATTEMNALWGSYSRLNVDFSGSFAGFAFSGKSGTDAYVAGYDRDLNPNVIAGISVNYSDSSSNFAGIRSNSYGKGISPYLTYMFTPNVFGIARLSYSESGGSESYGVSASMNGIYRSGDWVGRGRLELGTNRADAGLGSKQSTTSYAADGELGYYLTPTLYGHVGLQLSDTDSADSYQATARIGIESNISRTTALSLKYERKIDDNLPAGLKLKVNSLSLAFRMRF